jgi:hypothetical protein
LDQVKGDKEGGLICFRPCTGGWSKNHFWQNFPFGLVPVQALKHVTWLHFFREEEAAKLAQFEEIGGLPLESLYFPLYEQLGVG